MEIYISNDFVLITNNLLQLAPYETQDDNAVYKGDGSKGYNVIQAGDLLVESGNADGTENDASES